MPAVSIEPYTEYASVNHEQLFQDIREQFKLDESIHSFKDLVTQRQNELIALYPGLQDGNLAAVFESAHAIKHIERHAMEGISPYWHHLETTAIQLFGSILACWAYYERFCILHKYQAIPISIFNNLPKDESQYQSEIVEHIENDSRYFYTLHSSAPLSLSDAVTLINLEVFIIENKWYEMLPLLQLSQKGSHFLLYYKQENRVIIVSTSLIQNWQDRKNWLSFDPFFQGNQWISCMPQNAGKYLYKTDIFNSQIKYEPNCEYEVTFSKYLTNPDAICEVLRLTVSGPKSFRYFLLYLCQKLLMEQLVNYGKLLSFTIIEQPVMLKLYQELPSLCYFSRCYNNINDSEKLTYKGFWFTTNLRDDLSKLDYKKYKSLIIKKSRMSCV